MNGRPGGPKLGEVRTDTGSAVSSKRGEHCSFHKWPIENDLREAEAQYDIVFRDEFRVTFPVLTESRGGVMKLPAVDFDDYSATERHVDAANTRKFHLLAHPDTKFLESLASDRLRPGIASAPRPFREEAG